MNDQGMNAPQPFRKFGDIICHTIRTMDPKIDGGTFSRDIAIGRIPYIVEGDEKPHDYSAIPP